MAIVSFMLQMLFTPRVVVQTNTKEIGNFCVKTDNTTFHYGLTYIYICSFN